MEYIKILGIVTLTLGVIFLFSFLILRVYKEGIKKGLQMNTTPFDDSILNQKYSNIEDKLNDLCKGESIGNEEIKMLFDKPFTSLTNLLTNKHSDIQMRLDDISSSNKVINKYITNIKDKNDDEKIIGALAFEERIDNLVSQERSEFEKRMLEFDKLIHTLKAIEIAYIKKSMTIDDLVNYTGFKVSYIYKLTSGNLIPHSKPGGGKVFFDKDEIDIWLLSNREDSKMPKD